MDQYIGKFLDNRYELLEVIGTGGMAVVYKARCHRLNRLVAVKVLKSDLAKDAEFRRRFHDESQAVAMLSHPNIVAVYDVSHSEDLDYIVMELIDGITLKQYMQQKGAPLNWREAQHFITQIMRALSHAHSRGIIHRDIKPHNIMVLRDGSVKVSDFGIARITSAHQSTLTQEALGSVHYISPEQARGSHIDARSDIYSAGVVLYEMITGRLPFEGETPVAVAIQHINSIPLSPRELNPNIPEALEEITMKAMAPNPDERYLSADDMLVDLEEFRKNPNINFEYISEDLPASDEPTRKVPPVGGVVREGERKTPPKRQEPERRQKPRKEREEVEDDYDDRRGPVWPMLLAVGAILVFLVVVIRMLWINFVNPIMNPVAESVPVPDLVGRTITEIRQDPSVTDVFEIIEGESVPSDTIPVGQVVRQSPGAGEVLKREQGDILTVTVYVSSGGDVMTIPNVENMEQRMAMELLRDRMGLLVSQQLEPSEEITKGYAIRTDLPEGTPVKRGDTVTLVVSAGPDIQPVTVISFTNIPLDQAKQQITDLRLEVGTVTEEPSDLYEAGVVFWQNIPVGTTVAEGTTVDLKVSSGPAAPVVSDNPPTPSSEVDPTPPSQSDAPSTETPPPAPPSPPVLETVSKRVTVELPANAAGKESVRVRVEVDGEVKKSETVPTIYFPLSYLVKGSGTQRVSVYVDGDLVSEYLETFS